MWLLCSLSGHRRSAKLAKRNFHAEQWESVCKHCGISMVRIARGEWRIRNEGDQPAGVLPRKVSVPRRVQSEQGLR
jgi:hypothetical protein